MKAPLAISSHSIAELVEPSKTIEKHLDESTKIMGNMARDAFYMLDNQVILNNNLNQLLKIRNQFLRVILCFFISNNNTYIPFFTYFNNSPNMTCK